MLVGKIQIEDAAGREMVAEGFTSRKPEPL